MSPYDPKRDSLDAIIDQQRERIAAEEQRRRDAALAAGLPAPRPRRIERRGGGQ